jgi:hypothetical protein
MADQQSTLRNLDLSDGGQVPEDLARLAVEVIVASDPWYAVGLLTGSLGRLLRTKFPQEQHAQMIARFAEHIALASMDSTSVWMTRLSRECANANARRRRENL